VILKRMLDPTALVVSGVGMPELRFLDRLNVDPGVRQSSQTLLKPGKCQPRRASPIRTPAIVSVRALAHPGRTRILRVGKRSSDEAEVNRITQRRVLPEHQWMKCRLSWQSSVKVAV
jgi:hypothetical protein